jgi:hypothetical protein
MQASISFNQSHKSSLSHNNREHDSGNKDIDPERSHLNIYFVKEDLREVYQELFQEAVDSYNAKQSRNDRKIEDYYVKIHNDSKTHEQRELIVAIGEGKDPGEFRNGKREALIKYAEEFQERNPNLRVYNMVLHDDEANPHLHINYVSHFESKKGLSKRAGMDKALQQQGIEGKGTELIGKWRTIETGRIEALAKEHIPGFERANVGSHKYMKVEKYKEYAEAVNMARREVENQKVDLEYLEQAKKAEKAKLSELEQYKSGLVDEIKENKIELQRSAEKFEQLQKEVSNIEVTIGELDSIKETRVFKKVTVSEKDYDMIKSLAKKSLDQNKTGLELERENRLLKQENTNLEIIKQDQERRIHVLGQQKEQYRQESLNLKRENKTLLREKNIFQKLYATVKQWIKSRGINFPFDQIENTARQQEKEQQQKVQEIDRD